MNIDSDLALALKLQEEFSQDINHLSTTPKNGDLSPVDPSWEFLDPNPDIRALFLQFNDRFFWGALAGIEVKWSPRMTLCAGLCVYERRGGLCSVRLSLPLLKLRPRKDLVETLLHEMIHAYLFITDNNKDHDGHGPEFHKHMYRINNDIGSNISVYHTFHDEVDEYRKHWWRCTGPCKERKPFFGFVKRAMNRAPSARDPWWADHQRTCNGTFVKIKEPENYGKKGKKNETKVNNKQETSKAKIMDIRTFVGQGNILGKPKSLKGANEMPTTSGNKNNVIHDKSFKGQDKVKPASDQHLLPWKRKGFISNADPRRKSSDPQDAGSQSEQSSSSQINATEENTIESDSDEEAMANLLDAGYDQLARDNDKAWEATLSDSDEDEDAIIILSQSSNKNSQNSSDEDSPRKTKPLKRPRVLLSSGSDNRSSPEPVVTPGPASDVQLKLREIWGTRFTQTSHSSDRGKPEKQKSLRSLVSDNVSDNTVGSKQGSSFHPPSKRQKIKDSNSAQTTLDGAIKTSLSVTHSQNTTGHGGLDCPPLLSGESIETDSSQNHANNSLQEPSGSKVPCPVCNKEVLMSLINQHLDQCLP